MNRQQLWPSGNFQTGGETFQLLMAAIILGPLSRLSVLGWGISQNFFFSLVWKKSFYFFKIWLTLVCLDMAYYSHDVRLSLLIVVCIQSKLQMFSSSCWHRSYEFYIWNKIRWKETENRCGYKLFFYLHAKYTREPLNFWHNLPKSNLYFPHWWRQKILQSWQRNMQNPALFHLNQ